MFLRSPKVPPKPSYRNPDALEGTKSRADGSLRAWEFGKEIDLYNSRNIYTRGGDWRRRGEGGVPWVEVAGNEYVELSSDLVPSTTNPRFRWEGWTRGWRERFDTVRAERLFVHRDDIFPRPQSRAGNGAYRTRRVKEAWDAWEKFGGVGVRWAGDGCLEVEYASDLDSVTLASIGWKRGQDGALLDIDTPLPGWIISAGFFLPGHDPLGWAGVSKVAVKFSGAEGCVPGSFAVDSPSAAGRLLKGCQALPRGCEVKIDDRFSLGLFSGRCVPWMEGKVAIPARRMVPLNKGVKNVVLHISRAGKAAYLVDPGDIDFSRLVRPVIGAYFGRGGEEKCLVTRDASRMKAAGVVTRAKVVENPGIFYRVVAPMPNGKKTSPQKMAGAARVGRLPAHNKGEQERLESLYGDVVGEDYYRKGEQYYREAARIRDQALSDGFLDLASARERSAVPGEVFDRLAARGAIPTRTIPTGKKYFKPVGFGDIAGSPRMVEHITRIAIEDELGWLCQLAAAHPREFTRALVAGALGSH